MLPLKENTRGQKRGQFGETDVEVIRDGTKGLKLGEGGGKIMTNSSNLFYHL